MAWECWDGVSEVCQNRKYNLLFKYQTAEINIFTGIEAEAVMMGLPMSMVPLFLFIYTD